MPLGKGQQRAYWEAWRRHTRGTKSPKWRGSEDDVRVWMDAFDLGRTSNISPWDALLLAVQRRAARVEWCDQVISEKIKQERKQAEEDGREWYGPSDDVRTWLGESRNEERLLTRSAAMAISAGVAEATIRQMEREGRIVTEALVAGLDVLELSPEQRLRAMTVMHRKLTAGVDNTKAIDVVITEDDPGDQGVA